MRQIAGRVSLATLGASLVVLSAPSATAWERMANFDDMAPGKIPDGTRIGNFGPRGYVSKGSGWVVPVSPPHLCDTAKWYASFSFSPATRLYSFWVCIRTASVVPMGVHLQFESGGTEDIRVPKNAWVQIVPQRFANDLYFVGLPTADDIDVFYDNVVFDDTVTPPARPDLMIRLKAETKYTGAGVHNTTGKGQMRWAKVLRRQKAVYYLRAQNNSGAADSLTIKGAGGVSGRWQVAYFDAKGRPITGSVTGSGWLLASLGPKAAVDFRVEVTPLAGAPVGKASTVRVEAKSRTDPTVRDVVKAVTTPRANPSPTAQISSLAAVPAPGGADMLFSLSGGARIEARILNIAGRPVRTLCRDRAFKAGPNTLAWDGRAESGLRVPAGSYLVEITARTPEGTQSRDVAPLRVNR
jgi:hypothetical protein